MTYNPLDKENLAKSVANAFLARPIEAFPVGRFQGAGVYALYYTGLHTLYDLYERLKVDDLTSPRAVPIYIGRSVSQGARKGKKKFGDPPGAVLYNRLRIHASSIEQEVNLDVRDFLCRSIIIDEIWVPLAESLLITTYAPVWNQAVEGFGIKTPGKGRAMQKRSEWDVLHPGHGFAVNLATAKKTETELRVQVQRHIDAFFTQQVQEVGLC
ncbi:Eco29kI family restriction endonuclease [Candidatus Gracilibacteria bacterium]|nr:Eco29kI family restriction endonuclease [Candidatus Gracilibacteria bacterium]